MKRHVISIVFLTATAYNTIMGLTFILAAPFVFRFAGVTEPNHYGYVQLPAALFLVFATMFYRIARRPLENRVLIPYAILAKLCLSIVVIGHWLFEGIPYLWKPLAIYNLLFAGFFYVGYASLARQVK